MRMRTSPALAGAAAAGVAPAAGAVVAAAAGAAAGAVVAAAGAVVAAPAAGGFAAALCAPASAAGGFGAAVGVEEPQAARTAVAARALPTARNPRRVNRALMRFSLSPGWRA